MVPEVLVATWQNGVFAVGGAGWVQELPGCSVRALTPDGNGGALAVVDLHSLRRRAPDGTWSTRLTTDAALSCCIVSGGSVYLGTDDARVLHLNESDELVELPSFGAVEGRETWFAGQALVDGRLMGPPLGIRSITATADGVLLANVHVGGIPRSVDAGTTWQPTIAVDTDVHEVRAHPVRTNVVAAASAAGLCISSDAGATWTVERGGLHAPYCSAVAFVGDDVWVAASSDHFAPRGRIYRRSIAASASASAVAGLPEWTDGIVDTHCLAVNGSSVAIADRGGDLHVSHDSGRSWSLWAYDRSAPSSVLIP